MTTRKENTKVSQVQSTGIQSQSTHLVLLDLVAQPAVPRSQVEPGVESALKDKDAPVEKVVCRGKVPRVRVNVEEAQQRVQVVLVFSQELHETVWIESGRHHLVLVLQPSVFL